MSPNIHNLQRFIDAREHNYATALAEIKAGKKRPHWIWYIFPQLKGLGQSSYYNLYGIENSAEAKSYLAYPVLGVRLQEIAEVLPTHSDKSAKQILGALDALKVRSSMTLFDTISLNDIFIRVLERLYYRFHRSITQVRAGARAVSAEMER